jgi:RNA polymerase sigma factor (sigma-70 family)
VQEEKALVRRILYGDAEAFRKIIQAYGRLVNSVVSRMVLYEAEREDLSQEVFVKVYENLRHFRFECKMSTWIARIAYNTCLNFLEKKRPSLLGDELPDGGGADALPAGGPLPDEVAHRRGVSMLLEREIARLPVKHRVVLTLYHLLDMRYEEIGEALGLPPGTVKSHLFRARAELHRRLAASYSREELEA